MPFFSKIASFTKTSIFPFIILLVAGFAVYSCILDAPFHYDDNELLLDSPLVKNLSAPIDALMKKNLKAVTFFTFALNYQVSRTDPFGYHLVNVFIHIFSSSLLYFVICSILSTPALKTGALFEQRKKFSLFAALIFLVHPLQTQAVTYIWQRAESLSGFFYLACYLLYLTGRLRKQPLYYVFSILLFSVGFFAKGIIASFPVMVLLTEVFFFSEKPRPILLRTCKFLVLFIIVFVVLSFIPYEPLHEYILRLHMVFMGSTGLQISQQYFLTQFRVIPQYLRLSFLPLGQNLDYTFPMSQTGWNFATVSGFLITCSVLLSGIFIRKKYRLQSFGIFWFFVCLLPTTFIFREPIWEHRTYLSVAGFSMFAVSLLFAVVTKERLRDCIIVLLICVLGVMAFARNSLWKDPVVLMEDTVEKSPGKARPNQVLGLLYRREGNLEKAKHYLNKALSIKPNYPEAHNNLGLVYLEERNFPKAKEHFQKAISVKKDFLNPYINLATLAIKERDYEEGKRVLNKSLVFGETAEIYLNLGNVHSATREYEKARDFFNKALKLDPYSWESYYSLGNTWFYERDFTKAIEFYKKSVELNADHCDIYLNTGMSYYYLKDMESAQQWLEKALEVDPKRDDVRAILDRVFYKTVTLETLKK